MRRIVVIALLQALCASGTDLAAQDRTPIGHWEGQLTLRGDVWPLRLDVTRPADSTTATLDLPDLGMAWQPLPVRYASDTLTLELPFGLGTLAAQIDSASLHGWRITGSGDTLQLELRRRQPFPMTKEAAVFSNGAATLHGTLVRPQGSGPFPAVVLVHGSAAQGRHSWAYRSMADFFVRRGFAALYYDKRGVGASTGTWITTSFPNISDLVTDLQAATRWLRAQPGIDGNRIGVFGGSQALWVSARAAATASPTSTLNFMVMRGAPAVTPQEQELQRVRYSTSDADSVVQAALQHTQLYFDVIRTGRRFDELLRSVRYIRAQPWGEELLQADTPDDLYWWQHNYAFDVSDDMRRLRIPMLFLYGERDTVVPPSENAARMAELVKNAPATVLIFPRANHSLEVPSGDDGTGQWRFPRRAPGSFEAIDAWLRANVTLTTISRP